jgi:O-antigen/teichoic acid export membrane protein
MPDHRPPPDAVSDPRGFAGKSIRGAMITVGSQGAKFVLNAAAIVIMARLLAPEDFGLVGMVLPIVTLITLFQDFGLSSATIQRHEISHAQSSNLFWLNVTASVMLAMLVVGLSPAVAWFYGDPRLLSVTAALGLLVLFSGLTAQHLALLTRRMQFTRLAKQDVGALAISVSAGVIAALAGLRYWALVVALASRSLALLVLVWAGSEWRPSRPSRRSGVRPLLRFGRDLTIVRLGTFLIENMDSVLIGKVWGGYALGFYDRAYSVLKLYKQINGPVNTVANSVLSRLQHDPRLFREYYVKGMGLVTGLSMPFMVFLAANATDVIRIALGEKWLAAVPIFLALAPAAFVATIYPATWWIYSSLGRTDRQLKWAMYVQLPITLAAYVAGLPYGPFGVALAFSIVSVALRAGAILYCLNDFKTYVRLGHVLGSIMPAAFSSLAAAAVEVVLKQFVITQSMGPVAAIAIDVALYGVLYAAIYCAMPIGRHNVATYTRVIGRSFGYAQ